MKEGDKIEVVEGWNGDFYYFGISKGQKFVAGTMFSSDCGRAYVEIGLPYKTYTGSSPDSKCGIKHNVTLPYYGVGFLRVLEPEYRTVEIAVELKELELTQN